MSSTPRCLPPRYGNVSQPGRPAKHRWFCGLYCIMRGMQAVPYLWIGVCNHDGYIKVMADYSVAEYDLYSREFFIFLLIPTEQ
jgi:hypothetical protein